MASTRARAAVPPLVDEAARASFRTNGYLTVPGVLSPAELHELRAVADAWLDESRNTLTPTASFDLEPTHTAAAPQLRRVKNPSSNPAFAALHTHPAILDIARTLVGDNFRGGGSKLNLKLPGGGSPVLWHQDWAFYPQSNDNVIAIGICLDDATCDNGAMLVMPGSHQGPTLDHHIDGVFVGAVTDSTFTGENAVPLCVKAGGVTVHAVRTLHGSAANTSPDPRRFLILPFFAADAFPLRTDVQPRFVGNNIDCELGPAPEAVASGAPSPAPRWVTAPVRIPLPRVEEGITGNSTSGSIYESHSVLPHYEQAAAALRRVTNAWWASNTHVVAEVQEQQTATQPRL